MLVARKGNMQIHIQDEDADGFREAGYELYREELVPVDAHTVSISNIQRVYPADTSQPITLECSSKPVIPEYHSLKETHESD